MSWPRSARLDDRRKPHVDSSKFEFLIGMPGVPERGKRERARARVCMCRRRGRGADRQNRPERQTDRWTDMGQARRAHLLYRAPVSLFFWNPLYTLLLHARQVMRDFYAESFKLDNHSERKLFYEASAAAGQDQVWICKPAGLNCGRGIYLVADTDKFRESLEKEDLEARRRGKRSQQKMIQRYVKQPLLVRGRKFDLRAYMLIASTAPDVVLAREGYARLSIEPYSLDNLDNKFAHLTNQAIQKKHADYEGTKDDTVWSMSALNDYVNSFAEEKGVSQDWVLTTLTKRMHSIMLWCYLAARPKLDRRPGFFDLLGFDFLVDDDMNCWLIEINDNPSLSTSTEHLADDMPCIVNEALGIATEVFDRVRKKQPPAPVERTGNYKLLFVDSGRRSGPPRVQVPASRTSVMTRTLSPPVPPDDTGEATSTTTPIAGRPNSAPPYRGGLLKPTRASSARVKARLDAAKRQVQPAASNPSLSRPSSSQEIRRGRGAEPDLKRVPAQSKEQPDRTAASATTAAAVAKGASASRSRGGVSGNSDGDFADSASMSATAEPAESQPPAAAVPVEHKTMTAGASVVETPQVTAVAGDDAPQVTAACLGADRVLARAAGHDTSTTITLGVMAHLDSLASGGRVAGLSNRQGTGTDADFDHGCGQDSSAVGTTRVRPKSVPAGGRAAAARRKGE